MSLPARQQRALDGLAGALCVDDPHLAGMFTIFARLNAGEPVTAEPRARRRRWPRPGPALSAFVVVLVTFALIVVSAVFGGARSVKSCVAAPLSRPACQTYAPAAPVKNATVKNRPRP
jgi:Protein of unknown function (DUF3040)